MVLKLSTAAADGREAATRKNTPLSKPHPFNRINSHDTVATSVQVAMDAEAMAREMQQIVAGYAPPKVSSLKVSSRTRKKTTKTKTQKQMKITTVQQSSLTIGKYKTKQKNPVSANAASNTGPKRKKGKGEFIGRKLNPTALSTSYSSTDSSSSSSCSSNDDDYTSDGDDRTNDDETCTSRSGSSVSSSSSDDNTSRYDCVDSSLGPSSSSSSYDGRTDSYNLSEFGSTSFTTGAFSQSYTNHTRFNDSQSYTNHTRGDDAQSYTNHTRDSCYTSASQSFTNHTRGDYTTEGEESDSDHSSSSGSCSSGSSRGHRSTDVEENAAEYDTDFHTQDSHDIENEDDDDDDDNHSQTVRAARSRNPGGLKIIAGTATTSTSRRGRSPMPRVKSTNSITVSVDEILSDEEEEFSRIRSPRRNIPLPMSKSTMSTYDDDDDDNDDDEDGYTTATTGDGTSYCTRDDTCTSYDDDEDSRFEEEGYYTTSYEDLHDDDTDTSRSYRNRKQQKQAKKHQSSMSDNDFDHPDPEDNNSITAAADPIIKCMTEDEIIHPPSRSTMHTDKTATATATTMSTSPRSTKLLGIINTTFDSLDNEQKDFEQFVKEQDALERNEKERVRLLAEKRKKDLELALNGGKTKKKQENTTDDDSSIAAGNSVFSWIFGSGSVFSGSTTPAITVKSAPAAGTVEVAQPDLTVPDLSSNKKSKTTVAASSTSLPPKKIKQKDKNMSTTTPAPLMKMETEKLSTKASALAYESDAFDNVEDSDAFDSIDSTTVDDEDNGGGENDNDNSITEMKQSSTNRTTGSADPIGSTGYISYEEDLMNPTTITMKNQSIENYPNTSIENIVCGIEHFNHILDGSDDFSVGETYGGLRDDEYILSSKEVLSPCCGTPNDPSMHVRKFTFAKNTDTTDDRREGGGNVIVNNTGSPTKRIQAENLEHYEISEIMHGKTSCKVQKESSTASISPPTASLSTTEEQRAHRQSPYEIDNNCDIVEEDVDDEKHINTKMIAEEPMDDSIISVESLSVENCDKQQQRPRRGRESIGTNSAVNNDLRNMSSEPTYTIQTNSIVQDDASLPSKDKPDELMELVRNAFAVILSPDNNSTAAISSMLHSDNNIDYEKGAKLPPRSPILPPISSENVLGVVYNFFSSKNEDPAFLLSSESKAFNEIENDDGSNNAIKCTGWNPNTQNSLTAQASTESIPIAGSCQTNTSTFLSKDTISLTIATPASPSTSCFNEDGIPLDVSPKKIWKAFDSGFEAVPSVSKNVRNTSQVSSTKTSSPIVKTINGATTADTATNINHRNSRSKEPIINGSVKAPKPTYHQVMMNQVEVKQQKQSDARRGVSLSARYRTQRHADFLSKRLKQRKESRSPLKRRISDGFLQKHKKEDRNTNHQPPDSSKSFVKRVATHARSIGLSVSTAFESSSSPSTGTTPTQLAGTIKYDKIISPVVSPTTKSRSSSKTPLSPSPDTSSAISSQKTNLSDIRSRIRQRRRTKIFPKRTASSVPPPKRNSNNQASSPSSPRRSSFSLSPTKRKNMSVQSYPIRTVPILESRDDSEVSNLNTDEFYDAVSFDDDKGGVMKAHNGIDCCTASKELLPEDQERDFPDISYKESMLSAVMSLD